MIDGYSVSDHGEFKGKSIGGYNAKYTNEMTFEELQAMWNKPKQKYQPKKKKKLEEEVFEDED